MKKEPQNYKDNWKLLNAINDSIYIKFSPLFHSESTRAVDLIMLSSVFIMLVSLGPIVISLLYIKQFLLELKSTWID